MKCEVGEVWRYFEKGKQTNENVSKVVLNFYIFTIIMSIIISENITKEVINVSVIYKLKWYRGRKSYRKWETKVASSPTSNSVSIRENYGHDV